MTTVLRNLLLVFIAPFAILMAIGLASGSMGMGSVELTLIPVIWIVGLLWVCRPRNN